MRVISGKKNTIDGNIAIIPTVAIQFNILLSQNVLNIITKTIIVCTNGVSHNIINGAIINPIDKILYKYIKLIPPLLTIQQYYIKSLKKEPFYILIL